MYELKTKVRSLIVLTPLDLQSIASSKISLLVSKSPILVKNSAKYIQSYPSFPFSFFLYFYINLRMISIGLFYKS